MLLKSLDLVRFISCQDAGGNTAMRCNLYAGARVKRGIERELGDFQVGMRPLT